VPLPPRAFAVFPGRCPGLSYAAPSGAPRKNCPRPPTRAIEVGQILFWFFSRPIGPGKLLS